MAAERRFTEEELILPALKAIYNSGGKLTTSELIRELTEMLRPTGKDMEILFGRNDTRFSQKVRNLISHKTILKYAEYKDHALTLNSAGLEHLKDHDFEAEGDTVPEYFDDERDFDGEELLDDVEDNLDEPKHVSVETLNLSVFELKRKYDRTMRGVAQNGLILDESFQRTNQVWGRKQKSQLLESILMGIPIPFIYLSEDKNGNLIVIDGRQRLTALFDFLDGRYGLTGLEFLPELNKRKIAALEENVRAAIEDTALYIIKIKFATPEYLKLQIFSRVNKNGTPLNAQEIRHALHQGAVTELLAELSSEFDIINKKRMKDRYLILRYLAFSLYFGNKLIDYNTGKRVEFTDINGFLGHAMDAINTFSDKQINDLKTDFIESYQCALKLLGENTAFRIRQNKPINMILFESTLIIVSALKDKTDSAEILRVLDRFRNIEPLKPSFSGEGESEETPFERNLKYHRDSKENVTERMYWLRIAIGENFTAGEYQKDSEIIA